MTQGLLLTGKRGQGKTLFAISMARRYIREGRMVATNVDLFVEHLAPPFNKVRPYRLPDWPLARDLNAMPLGNPDPVNEKRNGLLLLDECAAFINSRSWNEDKKGRIELIAWLAQSRKFGWDLCMLAQHSNMIDSQIREALFERFGYAVNLEGMMIPFVSRLTYGTAKLPKMHRVIVRLGSHPRAPLCDRELFTGSDLYKGYNTLQVLNPEIGVPNGAGFFYLSAYDIKGRYLTWWQRMKKVIFGMLITGFIIGFGSAEIRHLFSPAPESINKPAEPEKFFDPSLSAFGSYQANGQTHVLLSDGRDLIAISVKRFSNGQAEYEIQQGVWVKGAL